VTGGGVSGSNMPSLPWTARTDVPPAEDTSVEALLAGTGLPAGADPEWRPVADVLAALSARPADDELNGLAAARAEFRRHVARPAQARQSSHRRPRGLVSRLGVKVGAATALVVMTLGGAAAAAYAGVLPSSWQQFAHHTIGAPAYRAHHVRPPGTGAAGPAVPRSGRPARETYRSGPPARPRLRHHPGPAHHVWPLAPRPFVPHIRPSGARTVHGTLVRPARYGTVRRPTVRA
jgi:hypothetical protein